MHKQSRNWTPRSAAGAALLAASLHAPATPLPITLAEPARATGTEVLQELEEIVLYGKRLEQRIQEEEERVYQIYNEVNDQPDLDVTCDFRYLDRSSYGARIIGTKRGCVPEGVARAIRAQRSYGPAMSAGCTYGNVSRMTTESTMGINGSVQMYSRPNWSFGSSHGGSCPFSGSWTVGYTTPFAELVWMSRRSEFQTQLARVLAMDERLQDLANKLDELTAEGRESVAMFNAGRQLRMAERPCISLPRAARVCRD
jgi:hypothetical protein